MTFEVPFNSSSSSAFTCSGVNQSICLKWGKRSLSFLCALRVSIIFQNSWIPEELTIGKGYADNGQSLSD